MKSLGPCIICGDPITQKTDSREHVITNAIGGRLKTRGFICKKCNNKMGHTWDDTLAEQLNLLCLFFGVVRQRGKSPSHPIQTTTGEKYLLQPGGALKPHKPTVKKTEREGGRTEFQITARTSEEARKILKGIKRNYPTLDIEETLRGAKDTTSYPTGLLNFSNQLGGELAGRSIVKTAAAYAHNVGLSVNGFPAALRYLSDPAAEACFGYYYETDLVTNRPPGVPIHCVAVSGNPDSRLLLAYVEFFAVHRMVICLSDQYAGTAIDQAYAIDPTTGKEVGVSLAPLQFSASDVEEIYAYGKIPDGSIERAFAEVLQPAMKRQFDAETTRQISDAVEYGFKNCGAKPGDILTEQQTKTLTGLIMQRLQPFLLHRIRMKHDPPRR